MTARIGNVAFDCVDVRSTARFWSEVLGKPIEDDSSAAFATIGGADGDRAEPAWYCNEVLEATPAKNRVLSTWSILIRQLLTSSSPSARPLLTAIAWAAIGGRPSRTLRAASFASPERVSPGSLDRAGASLSACGSKLSLS